MPNRHDIVEAARGYLGVPWRHQGRSRRGLDCAGLVVMVARDLGLSDYDTTSYRRHARGQAFVEHFRENMDPAPVSGMRPGDVLVFADGTYPCHGAIVSERHGRTFIVHAHATRRQIVEEAYAGEWPEKVKFCFRFRGLSET